MARGWSREESEPNGSFNIQRGPNTWPRAALSKLLILTQGKDNAAQALYGFFFKD